MALTGAAVRNACRIARAPAPHHRREVGDPLVGASLDGRQPGDLRRRCRKLSFVCERPLAIARIIAFSVSTSSGRSGAGKTMRERRAQKQPLSQQLQHHDSSCRSHASTQRQRPPNLGRADLLPVQPGKKSHQLRIIQTHPRRRYRRPAGTSGHRRNGHGQNPATIARSALPGPGSEPACQRLVALPDSCAPQDRDDTRSQSGRGRRPR